MESLTANLKGKVRRETLNGVSYLVAPLSMIVPGVLNGSRGAIYYPGEENARYADQWNGMPIVYRHPTNNGVPVSARNPKVLIKSKVGRVYNVTSNRKGVLGGEAWINVEDANRVDRRIVENLSQGVPIEISTGLHIDTVDAPPNSVDHKGRPYQHIARNYRADHLAILLDERGACSLEDGCGLLVTHKTPLINKVQWVTLNAKKDDEESEGGEHVFETEDQRKAFFGKLRAGDIKGTKSTKAKGTSSSEHKVEESPENERWAGKYKVGGKHFTSRKSAQEYAKSLSEKRDTPKETKKVGSVIDEPEMYTREEYIKAAIATGVRARGKSMEDVAGGIHKHRVERALKEGKDIPEKVLDEYPVLRKKYKKQTNNVWQVITNDMKRRKKDDEEEDSGKKGGGGDFATDEQRRAFFGKLRAGDIKETKGFKPIKKDTPTPKREKLELNPDYKPGESKSDDVLDDFNKRMMQGDFAKETPPSPMQSPLVERMKAKGRESQGKVNPLSKEDEEFASYVASPDRAKFKSFSPEKQKRLREYVKKSTPGYGDKPPTGMSEPEWDLHKRGEALQRQWEKEDREATTDRERNAARHRYEKALHIAKIKVTSQGFKVRNTDGEDSRIWQILNALPSDKADVSPEKACKILKDGEVHGQPLTKAQRGMFGAICGKRADNAWITLNFDPNQPRDARGRFTRKSISTLPPKRQSLFNKVLGKFGIGKGNPDAVTPSAKVASREEKVNDLKKAVKVQKSATDAIKRHLDSLEVEHNHKRAFGEKITKKSQSAYNKLKREYTKAQKRYSRTVEDLSEVGGSLEDAKSNKSQSVRTPLMGRVKKFVFGTNVFCATGEGGGVDPSCSKGGSGSGGEPVRLARKLSTTFAEQFAKGGFSTDPSGFRTAYSDLEDGDKLTLVKELASRGAIESHLSRKKKPPTGSEVVDSVRRIIKESKEAFERVPTNRHEKWEESAEYKKLTANGQWQTLNADASGDIVDLLQVLEDELGRPLSEEEIDRAVKDYIDGIEDDEPTANGWVTLNVFCPTGEGGGVDPSCSPGGKESKPKQFSVGDTLTHKGRIGVSPVEFRGYHNHPQTGEKVARVIFRREGEPPFEDSVPLSELSTSGDTKEPIKESPTVVEPKKIVSGKRPKGLPETGVVDYRGFKLEKSEGTQLGHKTTGGGLKKTLGIGTSRKFSGVSVKDTEGYERTFDTLKKALDWIDEYEGPVGNWVTLNDANCGIGKGGFLRGNDCAKGGGANPTGANPASGSDSAAMTAFRSVDKILGGGAKIWSPTSAGASRREDVKEVFKGIFSRLTLGTGPLIAKGIAAGIRHSPKAFNLLIKGLQALGPRKTLVDKAQPLGENPASGTQGNTPNPMGQAGAGGEGRKKVAQYRTIRNQASPTNGKSHPVDERGQKRAEMYFAQLAELLKNDPDELQKLLIACKEAMKTVDKGQQQRGGIMANRRWETLPVTDNLLGAVGGAIRKGFGAVAKFLGGTAEGSRKKKPYVNPQPDNDDDKPAVPAPPKRVLAPRMKGETFTPAASAARRAARGTSTYEKTKAREESTRKKRKLFIPT